jgi:hypothetical protein
VDEPPRRLVVSDGRPRRREAEAAPRALAAALDRPGGRGAAACTQRRLEARQLLTATRAELSPTATADDAPLRQEQVEHGSTLRGECAGTVPT